MLIQGNNFSLWWDIDRQELKNLNFLGRVEWLENRTELVLIDPLNELANLTNKAFVWMAVTELVCAGIESLAGFYGKDKRTQARPFCRFVNAFMDPDFSKIAKGIKGEDWTYCEHLQTYFRNGLDHGFSIEWGGLWHDGEDGTHGYLRPAGDGNGIAIDPRALVPDFRQAVYKYFAQLLRDGKNSTTGKNFQKRFDAILERRSKDR
jgi:hypothetical protein